ncbi:MAG: hypothetical protein IT442_00125 [Phycisphaeraceae bacterium]|nr:hypothetical protein [Phycisphaeraceae bacterium]
MIVVYGSKIFGRHNLTHVRTTCPECGKTGYFGNYEGRVWYSLYFLPLIPGQKRRVRRMCPSCKKGLIFTEKQWRKLQQEAVEPSVAAYSGRADDLHAAEEALQLVQETADRDRFYEIALLVEQHLSNHPRMLGVLAQAYSYFMMDEEAEAAFASSLSQQDDSVVRAGLVRHLLEANKLDEAATQLAELEKTDADRAAKQRLWLVERYQAQGRHQEALTQLDAYEQHSTSNDPKLIARMRKASEKRLGTGRAVKSTRTAGSAPPAPPRLGRLGMNTPVFLIGALLVCGALGYLYLCSTATVENSFIVTGLPGSYDVLVNGKTTHVRAGSAILLNLPMGRSRIEPLPDSVPFAPIEVETDCSFLGRPFFSDTLVINPDATAVIVYQQFDYAVDAREAGKGWHKLKYGQTSYWFDKIDYPFVEEPPEIRMPEGKRVTSKYKLSLLDGLDPVEMAAVLGEQTGDNTAPAAYLRQMLDLRPRENQKYLIEYVAMVGPDELHAFLQSKLDVQPAMIEWHRCWQQLMPLMDPEHDVVAEYRQRLAAQPQDKSLMYLLARVVEDPKEAEQLCRRAIVAPEPCAYAYHWLAYQRMLEHRLPEALQYAMQADRLAPDTPVIVSHRRDLQLACRQYPQLINEMDHLLDVDATNQSAITLKIQCLARMGSVAEARSVRDRWLREIDKQYPDRPEDERAHRRALLTSSLAAAAEDLPLYVTMLQQLEVAPTLLKILDNSPASLKSALETFDDEEADVQFQDLVLIYLLADAQHLEWAPDVLKRIRDGLNEGSEKDQWLASWLSGENPPSATMVTQYTGRIMERRLLYAILAARYPQDREEYRRKAKDMDYTLDFYHMALLPAME